MLRRFTRWASKHTLLIVLLMITLLVTGSILLLLWMADLLSKHYFIFWAVLKALST